MQPDSFRFNAGHIAIIRYEFKRRLIDIVSIAFECIDPGMVRIMVRGFAFGELWQVSIIFSEKEHLLVFELDALIVYYAESMAEKAKEFISDAEKENKTPGPIADTDRCNA